MKRIGKRIVLFILSIMVLTSAYLYMNVYGADDFEYENYIAVRVYPDASFVLSVKGSYSDEVSPWEQSYSMKELDMILEVSAIGEDVRELESAFSVMLNPSLYASLANVQLDLTGHSDAVYTNLTAFIDYPGYLGVNGSLGVVIEDPNEIVLDLKMETKLYYTIFSREEVQMMIETLPLLESQLATEIMAASNGYIVLEKLEITGIEEEPDHASFTAKLRLSGDFQKGIEYALENMDLELAIPEEPEEAYPLSMESFDYHISFDGPTLSLETDVEGTITGDFNGQLNTRKNMWLEELLESDKIDEEEKTLVALALPIDLHIDHLLIELTSMLEGNTVTTTFSIEDLGMEPPSFEAILDFLEEVSRREPPEDYKLILVGESSNNQYVVFTVPDETKQPIVQEEGMVVWDIENIENLSHVEYEVKTKQIDTTTIVVAGTIGLVVLGAAGYLLMKR